MRSLLRRPAALLAPALLLTAPAAARAQLPNPLRAPGPRAGIIAGLSSATLGGSDIDISGSGVDKKRRNGLVAGGYLTFPIVPGLPLAIRPELLYAQKGVRFAGNITDTGNGELKFALDYLELPVLLQLDVPNAGGLRPAVYAGPSVAYRVRCRVEANAGGSNISTGCGDFDLNRKFDVSAVVGGQLGFGLAGQALGIGVRYTHGFTSIAEGSDVKNRALAVYGAIEFGR